MFLFKMFNLGWFWMVLGSPTSGNPRIGNTSPCPSDSWKPRNRWMPAISQRATPSQKGNAWSSICPKTALQTNASLCSNYVGTSKIKACQINVSVPLNTAYHDHNLRGHKVNLLPAMALWKAVGPRIYRDELKSPHVHKTRWTWYVYGIYIKWVLFWMEDIPTKTTPV